MISKHYFKANLSKIKLRWNFSNFWPKLWFNPLKKIQYGDHVKSIFYSLEGLVFLTSCSVYLVTCWLHDILIYLVNYCSSGKSTYWLNNLVIYWLWLDLLTEWMTCRDCIALGGLHDCASFFLCLFYCELYDESPNLFCITQSTRGMGTSFWCHKLRDCMSNSR